jgi:hypothetical protein
MQPFLATMFGLVVEINVGIHVNVVFLN